MPTVAKFIGDFIKKELDNYLHIDLTTADILLKKVQENEKERKAMAFGVGDYRFNIVTFQVYYGV